MAKSKYIDETIDPAGRREEERGRAWHTASDSHTVTTEWYKYLDSINVLPKIYAKFAKQEEFEKAYRITKKFAEVFTKENGHFFLPKEVETANPNITCTLYQYQLKNNSFEYGMLINISGSKLYNYMENIRNFSEKCIKNQLDKSFYEVTKEVELFIIDSHSNETVENLRLYKLYFAVPNQGELQQYYTCSEPTTYVETEKLIQQGKIILGTAHFSVWVTKEDSASVTMDKFTVHDSCDHRCQQVAIGHYNLLNPKTLKVESVKDIPFYKYTNFFSPHDYKNSSLDSPYVLRDLSPSRTVRLTAGTQHLDKETIEKELPSWSNSELVGFIKEMKNLLSKNLFFMTMITSLIDKNKLPKNFITLIQKIGQSAGEKIVTLAEEAYNIHCKKEYLSNSNNGSYFNMILRTFENKEQVLSTLSKYYDYPLPMNLLDEIEEEARKELMGDQEKLINSIKNEMTFWSLKELQRFIDMEVKNNLENEQKNLMTSLKDHAINILINKFKNLCSNNIDANIYSEEELLQFVFNPQAAFEKWLSSHSFKENIVLQQEIKISIEKKAKKTLKESDDSQSYIRYILLKSMAENIEQLRSFVNSKILPSDIIPEEVMNQSTKIRLHHNAINLLKKKENELYEEQKLFDKAQEKIKTCATELLIEYQRIKADPSATKKEFIEKSFCCRKNLSMAKCSLLFTLLDQIIIDKIASLKASPDFDQKISQLKNKLSNINKKNTSIAQLVGSVFKNEEEIDLLSAEEWKTLIDEYTPKNQKKLSATKNTPPMKENTDNKGKINNPSVKNHKKQKRKKQKANIDSLLTPQPTPEISQKEETKVTIYNTNNTFFNRNVDKKNDNGNKNTTSQDNRLF
jgi:hypothetical protein